MWPKGEGVIGSRCGCIEVVAADPVGLKKIRDDAVVCESVIEFSDNLSRIAGQPLILKHSFSPQTYGKYQRNLYIWIIYQ